MQAALASGDGFVSGALAGAACSKGLPVRRDCSLIKKVNQQINYLMTESDQRRDRILRTAFECREELVTYARALLGNYAAAEDAVQEAMLVVVGKHDQFEEGTSVLAWCRSIVRIEVLRAKQRHQRERTLAQRVLDDSIDAAFEEFQSSRTSHERELRRDALAQCIEQISDRSKRVLEARFVEELAYPQIGQRLSMSIEAVRKALFRVKKQVRSCVETRLRTAL